MKLGMKIGLGPGDIGLDCMGPSFLSLKVALRPIFGLRLLWPNGWMHQDATWLGLSAQAILC